jgi:hypothetical protein
MSISEKIFTYGVFGALWVAVFYPLVGLLQ